MILFSNILSLCSNTLQTILKYIPNMIIYIDVSSEIILRYYGWSSESKGSNEYGTLKSHFDKVRFFSLKFE
jgi:hypothetical protein